MKNIILSLLMFPLMAFAQETQPKVKPSKAFPKKWEVGLNTATAFGTQGFHDELYIGGRNSVAAYRNFKHSQVGVKGEFGISPYPEDGYSLAFIATVNKIIAFRKLYLYGGGSVGYKHIQHPEYWFMNNTVSSGYVTGLQGGIVLYIGKHFAFNSEIGISSEQLWGDSMRYIPGPGAYGTDGHYETYRSSYFNLYLPVSIGIRYRFK